MPISQKLTKLLSKVKYELVEHRTVYTAFDKAQTLKVPEKIVGKTLVVKINGDFGLVLISAHQILDKAKFKKTLNNWRKKLGEKPVREIDASTSSASTLSSCRRVDFATEDWMKKHLIGAKVGTVPPFGNLWTPTLPPPSRPRRAPLPTFVEKSLFKNKKIIVNAGNYNISIKISPLLFKKLIPDLIIGNFGKVKR